MSFWYPFTCNPCGTGLVLDRRPHGKNAISPLDLVPEPGQQSADRTRQGYARKRILKPAGRLFYPLGVERQAA